MCGLRETLAIADLLGWAMANVPYLAEACRHYQQSAKHHLDPVRNQRVRWDQLLDIADVKVLFLQCYCKFKQRSVRDHPQRACAGGYVAVRREFLTL